MQEEEKYIAMLYEKIVYDAEQSIFIFKPIEVLDNCTMDFNTNIITSKTKKRYLSMEDEVLVFSEEAYCYGYPMLQSDLEDLFSDSDIKDITKDYYMTMIDSVMFGVYDRKQKKIKTILANKEELMYYEDDGWYFDFELIAEDEKQLVELPITTFQTLIDRIDQKDYETVRSYLNNITTLNEKIMDGILQVKDQLEAEIVPVKKSEPQVKPDVSSSHQLNDLIGLEEIKDEVKRLFSYLTFLSKSSSMISIDKPNLHMVFSGNPGTGKTTVARMIANLLYEMGYLRNQKFIEITPRSMIAEFVGQTAPKTCKLLKQYEGGVIFIDEAYVFSSKAQEFAQEAIVEIIKEMEKNDTVFIFAGYKDEIKSFINSNPGIASRVGYFIDFKDYTNDQLYKIFEQKVKRAKMKLDPGLRDELEKIFNQARGYRNFGNGRFVDKLFQKMLLEHALNTEKYKSKKKLVTFTKEDITDKMIERVLYEIDSELFGRHMVELEQVVEKLTTIKTEEYIDELISRVIYERLYNSSYHTIQSLTEKHIKENSDQILDDVKTYIKQIEKGKVHDQSMGFQSHND